MRASPPLVQAQAYQNKQNSEREFFCQRHTIAAGDVEVGNNGGVSGAATAGGGWLVGASMASGGWLIGSSARQWQAAVRREAGRILKMVPTRTTPPDLSTLARVVVGGAGGANDGRRDYSVRTRHFFF